MKQARLLPANTNACIFPEDVGFVVHPGGGYYTKEYPFQLHTVLAFKNDGVPAEWKNLNVLRPEGLRHTCRTPSCMNPGHFYFSVALLDLYQHLKYLGGPDMTIDDLAPTIAQMSEDELNALLAVHRRSRRDGGATNVAAPVVRERKASAKKTIDIKALVAGMSESEKAALKRQIMGDV